MKTRYFKGLFILVLFIYSANIAHPQEVKIRILKEGAEVKLLPKEDSLVIKELPIGSELLVDETIGEWIKVKLPPDEDGFVVTGYIHFSFVALDIKAPQPKQDISPPAPAHLPKRSFTIGGGVSSLTGEGSEYWNTGPTFGINIFGYISRNILLGGHIALHRWTPNENELIDAVQDIGFTGINWDISGQATIVGLIPSVRLIGPWKESQNVNVFAQVGLGYYFVNLNATVKGSYFGYTAQESIEESQNKPGLTVGGGIIIGKLRGFKLEIFPSFTTIFTDDGNTKYFSVSILIGK